MDRDELAKEAFRALYLHPGEDEAAFAEKWNDWRHERVQAYSVADAALAWFRDYLGRDDVVERVKRDIAPNVLAVMGDYDEVPPDEVFSRPRYEWIRMRLDTIARAALNAIGGKDGR